MSDTTLEGFPRGWFVIGFAEEIGPGEVKPLRYFGRELVAFRGESGEVSVLDAFCPHLGAHLGYGGKVVGDTVKCPFHAWRFDGKGSCVDVPYAKKIPPRAKLEPWLVREKNGLIFVWHGRGAEPDWEIPDLPEHDRDDWTGWYTQIQTIKTHPREIVENVADKAHFPEVHGTHVDKFENEFDGHMAIQRTEGVAYPRGGGKDHFKLVATYYGPAYQITEMESALPNRLINCHTPIDENTLHLRFGVMLKRAGNDERMAKIADMYVKNLQVGFGEDVQIWEHKVYRPQPMLADGDGAIGKLRRWYRQFYEDQPS